MTDQERQRIAAEHAAYIDNLPAADRGIARLLAWALIVTCVASAALAWRAFG
jgi:hypothetical protein